MFLLVSYRHFLSEVMTIFYEKPMCTFLADSTLLIKL